MYKRQALSKADKTCFSWGIRVEDGIAIKGEIVNSNGKEVGKITSSTWSPYQVCGVGIVYLNDKNLTAGSIVEVKCTDGKIHKGELCTLPMYDPKGDIVRGINKTIPTKPEPWSGIKG